MVSTEVTTANGTVTTAAPVTTRLRTIVTEVSGQFFERDDTIRALMLGVLAGQHSLLLGPPGTAKSDLARALTKRFVDAMYWEQLLGKFTTPTKLFGPTDLAQLMQGRHAQLLSKRGPYTSLYGDWAADVA